MEAGKTWAENLAISPMASQANRAAADSFLSNAKRYRTNADGPTYYEKLMPVRKSH